MSSVKGDFLLDKAPHGLFTTFVECKKVIVELGILIAQYQVMIYFPPEGNFGGNEKITYKFARYKAED